MLLVIFWLFCSVLELAKGQCAGRADVVIAVPGNSHVPIKEFSVLEKQIIRLINHWHIDPDNVNIGLILYGKKPVDIAWPNPFSSRRQINTRVTLLTRRGLYRNSVEGGSDVAAAIERVHVMLTRPAPGSLMTGMRHFVKRIGIIFQFGPAKMKDLVKIVQAIKEAEKDKILLYSVNANGIGLELLWWEICRIVYMDSFFSGLSAVIKDLGNGVCAEMDPAMTITYPKCFPQTYSPVKAQPVSCTGSAVTKEDPNNCAYYYYCVLGRSIQYKCLSNTIYDPKYGTCNFKERVSCYSDMEPSCKVSDAVVEHPTYCSKFINCYNYTAHVFDCPAGNWFASSIGLCIPKGFIRCPSHKIQ